MSDKTYTVRIGAEMDIESLARLVDDAIYDHDEILQFVLRLDEIVADYDFTKTLRDKLSEALKVEDSVARDFPGWNET